MIEVYERYHASVIGVKKVEDSEVSRYGIVDSTPINDRLFKINNLVEKPKLEDSPSNIAIMGRYILTPQIFDILENLDTGTGGEIQLTDAIRILGESEVLYAYEFEGKRYDVGEKIGFIKTIIDFALQRNDLRSELLTYMGNTLERETIKKN